MVAKSNKSSSSMHVVQLRTQSFARPIKVSSKLKLRWPHEKPAPEDLALAGFYYCPYEGAEDNVCCYLCEKNMGGWEEDDDPLKEHLRGNKSCAWAILRDILVRMKNGEELGDDAEDPRSDRMNELREATFDKWWPHDDKKGWNPKSKKMARAGFFYTPNDDSEDMVNCPYCLIGLDGWEPKDDPWQEHRNRQPNCAFFTGLNNSLPPSTTSSPVKSAKSEQAPTRTLRKSGGGPDLIVTPQKQQKTKRRLTRQNNIDDEDEEMFTSVESPPPSKRRKSTRITSQAVEEVKASPRTGEYTSNDKLAETKTGATPWKSRRASTNPRRTISTTKSAPIEIIEEDELPEPIPDRRVTRSAQTLLPPDLEIEGAAEKKTPAKVKGKHTRTKSRKVSALGKIVAEEEVQQPRRTSRRLELEEQDESREINDTPAIVDEVEEEVEEVVAVPKKKRGRQTKVNGTIKELDTDAKEEETQPVVEEPPKPKKLGRQSKAIDIPVQTVIDIEADDQEPAIETSKPKKRGRQSKIKDVAEEHIVDIEPANLEPVIEPPKPKKRGRQSKVVSSSVAEPIESGAVVELENEPIPVLPKKRGRQSKVQEPASTTTTPEESIRLPRQSLVSEADVEIEPEVLSKQAKPIVLPKRKRASTRATRVVSSAVQEMPDIEEMEGESSGVRVRSSAGTRSTVPVVEIPEREAEVHAETDAELIAEVTTSTRRGKAGLGRGRGQTRGRSTLTRPSSLAQPPPQDSVAPVKRGRGGRTVSKRAISALYTEDNPSDNLDPPAKRKASGLRMTQKLPTPSDESSNSDIYEDTKSTFSDIEDPPPQRTTKRRTVSRATSRSKILSEDRLTEETPSTIYHSAEDNLSSPAQSSVMGKSKRELVNNAKRELEDEIWRERVANGEVGIGGSSEDDEKENATEEKGKKPTRTVRGKGAKGSGRKAKGTGKKGKNAPPVELSENDDGSSAGESHALMVKAIVSPLRPGPVIAELDSEASSEDERLETFPPQITPIQSPKRKVLNWTPAKIDNVDSLPVTNGVLTHEEEEMTVEQWMRWVINDEVNRLEEECEKLVRNLEREGDRARRLLENLV